MSTIYPIRIKLWSHSDNIPYEGWIIICNCYVITNSMGEITYEYEYDYEYDYYTFQEYVCKDEDEETI